MAVNSERILHNISVIWSPASVSGSETTQILFQNNTMNVVAAWARVLRKWDAASTADVILGNSGDTDIYIASGDITETTVGTYVGTGAGFANSYGNREAQAASIDVVYTPGGDPKTTRGVVEFVIQFFVPPI
jgi:hypothetical protein